MADTPPSDGPSQGADFDMMGALDWKDGIATLPGSDIRVQQICLRVYTVTYWLSRLAHSSAVQGFES